MARIALVCEPPDGGVAEHVARLAAGLRAHGHEPVVFDSTRLPFRRDYAHPHRDAQALGALARALRGFDLVHAHAAKAGVVGRLAARLRARPRLHAALLPVRRRDLGRAAALRAGRRARARARHRRADLRLRGRARGRARERGRAAPLHVVHNGCPPCDAAPADGLVVGAVTVLRRQKRLDVLLAAAPRILDAVPRRR